MKSISSRQELDQREGELAKLRDAESIGAEAWRLAHEFTAIDPDAYRTKIEKYATLSAQSFLASSRPAAAMGVFVWLKSVSPLSDAVDRLARHLAQAIGRTPARKSGADERLPVPTPYQELSAHVSFEEFGTEEIQREHLVGHKVRSFPLFNHLRSVELLKLLETARHISLSPGETLFQETGPAHAIYLLASGNMEVSSTAQLVRKVEEGEFVGDISYFLCSPHSGTAIAKNQCEIVCFPRAELQACFEKVPRLHQALTDWVYQKIFLACAPQSLIFRALSMEQLAAAWDFFTPIHVPAGRVLMEPERACDRFFLILKGRVEVRREGEPSARVGPGHFIGERGLLLQRQRSAKLVCLSDCHLLECDEWTYQELSESFPEIPKSISERRVEIENYKFSSKNFVID